MDPLGIFLLLLVVAAVILVVVTTMQRRKNQPQVAADRSQAHVEAQALAMKLWRAACARANPRQPVPAPPAMAFAGIGASDRTNTMAILALIFGALGGYLAIVFGYIARSQIKRTGEGGGGLATAGLILGYLWLVVTIFIAFIAIGQLLIAKAAGF
jgi:hypothetical protein